MLDQLIIGDKASLDNFGASMAHRVISSPPKKSIRETVPHSNKTYDFSKINGELYWEERELEYTFEMIAPTPQILEEMKRAFSNWVMNVFEEKIFDPFIPDYHFLGTYSDMQYEDDESGEKTTATVVFKAYPYKLSNTPKTYAHSVKNGEEKSVSVYNDSSHRITPTIITDSPVTLKISGMSFAISAGTNTSEEIKLAVGVNNLVLQNGGEADCNIKIIFTEEVF